MKSAIDAVKLKNSNDMIKLVAENCFKVLSDYVKLACVENKEDKEALFNELKQFKDNVNIIINSSEENIRAVLKSLKIYQRDLAVIGGKTQQLISYMFTNYKNNEHKIKEWSILVLYLQFLERLQ